jgi:predicted acylesterase/phospholipase RssA
MLRAWGTLTPGETMMDSAAMKSAFSSTSGVCMPTMSPARMEAGPTRLLRHRLQAVATLIVLMVHAALLSACTTVLARNPVPEDRIDTAAPYGISGDALRIWGDELTEEQVEQILTIRTNKLRSVMGAEIAKGKAIPDAALLLSGGGADGAFGAGLLNGWTARGDRPEFSMVTGISTGAIIAVFAYLGPDYDDELKQVYTAFETKDLLQRTFFSALTGGMALADTSGYRRLIDKYVDDEVIARLADEHRQGRVLLIGTTNLDAARPVIWNVSGIAATGDPMAKRLIQDVIEASSAIPAAFPPVLIPVVGDDGQKYDEMHVDGGATQQVMLFSPQVPLRALDQRLGARFDRTAYVVVNNKIDKSYDPVRPRLLAIVGAATGSLIVGSGSGDIYKIFAIAERDGVALKIVSIPREFDFEQNEPFDPVYMQALYDLGYEYGLAGDRWSPRPPGFSPWP